VASALLARGLVRHQERGLLKERASEVSLVLASLISNVQAKLNLVGHVSQASSLAPQSFTNAASAGDRNLVGVALVRPSTEGFVAEQAAGPQMSAGQTFTGPRADAMRRALAVPALVGTPVMVDHGVLMVGFALGPPAAPPGTVVYRESVIHPGVPSRTTASAPFSELVVSVFASSRPDATQLILKGGEPGQSTEPKGALLRPFAAGDSHWLLSVAARRPLVGPLVAWSPLFILVIGMLVSLAIFAVIEAIVRRRDYALGLVDERTAELQASLRSLKAAELEALQASHLKSQFLANMSHEIRTPMNGVLGMAQLVLTGSLEPDQRTRMLGLHETGQSLLSIINDILDFSKMEAGRLELEKETFDLVATVEGAVSLMASPANDKGLSLSLNMNPDVPRWVLGDSGRLRQILVNLIGNAVKFTEHGSVTVAVSQVRAGSLRFAVRDTGVGIDLSLKAHLLEPFSQADASTTRVFGGTGLGLAICRQLVELMDGNLDFTSEPGVGTTFWFEVDIPAAQPPASVEASSTSRGIARDEVLAVEPPASGVGDSVRATVTGVARSERILVVDDAEINRVVARGLLESAGFRVDSVSSGAEAIEAARPGGYAAILMDCLMPVMDGYEATRRIRELEGPARNTLIIALTAAAMNGDRERCIAAGMDEYVSKPIDLKILTSVLARCQPAETFVS